LTAGETGGGRLGGSRAGGGGARVDQRPTGLPPMVCLRR
jgi:hypothetical protein